MRIKWNIVIGLILCIALICGCSNQVTKEENLDKKKSIKNESVEGTIEFVNWMTENPEAIQAITDRFQEEYPNVTIAMTTIPYDEIRSYIMARNSAGYTADVYQLNMPWTSEMVEQGVIMPLNDLLANAEDFKVEDMISEPMRQIDGSTYMVPLTVMHFVLYCNMDHFEEAGIEEPKTWEEMQEAAILLTNPNENQYGFSLAMSSSGAENGAALSLYPLLYSAGGRTIDNGEPNIESEEMLRMMTFVDELYNLGVIAPGTLTKSGSQVIDDFASGKASMMIQPSTHIATVRNLNAQLKFNVVKVPGPEDNNTNATRLHGFELGIGSKSEDPDLAMVFISWLTSPENNGWVSEQLGQMPANVRADTSYFQKDDLIRETYAMLRKLEPVEELMFTPETSETWRIFTDQTQKMFLNELTPEQTISEIQSGWEELFDK